MGHPIHQHSCKKWDTCLPEILQGYPTWHRWLAYQLSVLSCTLQRCANVQIDVNKACVIETLANAIIHTPHTVLFQESKNRFRCVRVCNSSQSFCSLTSIKARPFPTGLQSRPVGPSQIRTYTWKAERKPWQRAATHTQTARGGRETNKVSKQFHVWRHHRDRQAARGLNIVDLHHMYGVRIGNKQERGGGEGRVCHMRTVSTEATVYTHTVGTWTLNLHKHLKAVGCTLMLHHAGV